MSVKNTRTCPACQKAARTRPLPPEGFWQERVLQPIGMYPYRCEACGARFYRRTPIGEGLGEARHPIPTDGASSSAAESPKLVGPPEAMGDSLSSEEFGDFIDQISRSEKRKGLKVPRKEDESE